MKFMDDYKENYHHKASKKVISNAKELRQKNTKAELVLWEYLRDRRLNGKKFRRQHAADNYILDFYCHEHKLGIELDGGVHNKSINKEYDRLRELNLKNCGIKIIRFTNEDVINNLAAVLSNICTQLT